MPENPLSAESDVEINVQLPRYRLAALTRVKFDGDIIEEFARHTLQYVDRLYVVDNASPDRARDILGSLVAEGLPITVWEDEVHESDMSITTTLARRVFEIDKAKHLLLLDADEFLRVDSRATLEAALQSLPLGTHALIPWVTYLPTPEDGNEPRLLGRIRRRRRTESSPASKVIVARVFAYRSTDEIIAGSHGVGTHEEGASQKELENVALAHFPVRSIAQLQGKAFLGWASFLIMGPAMNTFGYQWRRLYEELEKNADWTERDLYHLARTYLDENDDGVDLVLDPMTPVERKYRHDVPELRSVALAHVRLLAEYCVQLKAERDGLKAWLSQQAAGEPIVLEPEVAIPSRARVAANWPVKAGSGSISYRCNICGTQNGPIELKSLNRESGFCSSCESNVRLRALALLVGKALFNTTLPLVEWPSDKTKMAYGISDWFRFEHFYESKIGYVNTQFDWEMLELLPTSKYLDITKPEPDMLGNADIVICSEVLEHIPHPVDRAFEGLFALLKPGGALIMTVPYAPGAKTLEHFPELFDWHIDLRHEEPVLRNKTRDGKTQEFRELSFHGGGPATLEMRIFGLDDALQCLERAGFTGVTVESDDHLEIGIRNGSAWSYPITARRPR